MLSLVLLAGCGGERRRRALGADRGGHAGGLLEPAAHAADRPRSATPSRRGSGSRWPTPAVASGRYTIKLVELDSAEPDERDWDPTALPRTPGTRPTTPPRSPISGELELGASAVSVPVTNEESILQVSPTDGLTSLTVPQSGAERRARALLHRRRRATSSGSCRRTPRRPGRSWPWPRARGARGSRSLTTAASSARQLAGGVEQAAATRGSRSRRSSASSRTSTRPPRSRGTWRRTTRRR